MNFKKLAAFAVCALASAGALHADLAFRQHRYSSLKATPADNIEVMFVGNSITNMHEWWEAFGSDQAIAGRGNSGGVTQEILDNLESYIDGKPKKLFLMIGTNDIGRAGSNTTADLTARKIRAILMRIQLESPETEIYMQSILPRSGMNGAIARANTKIQEYCTELGVHYIDLTQVMKDLPSDNMWSNDGLHPQTKGYSAWTHYIEEQVGRSSVYPLADQITSYQGQGTQSDYSRTAQFPFLPVNEGDILIFGDDLVHGGEWHELLGSPKAKDRGTHWGTGGINLEQGRGVISATLSGRTNKPSAIIINYGEGGKVLNNYRLLVQEAKNQAPDAKIICMSLPPRANSANDQDNVNFNNNVVKTIAEELGVTYLDIFTPLAENRAKYIMNGSYITGPGYVLIANEIAKVLNDPDLNPVTPEDADKLIQRRTIRSIVGDKITEAILFNDDFDDPALSAELSAGIETAAKAITNTMTTAQANAAANKLDALMMKITGALFPSTSNDQETHWYIIRSVRGNRAATAEGDKVLGLQDEISPAFTYGHNVWKLVERDDADTYDIVNMRGEYVSAEGVANNTGLIAVTEQPAGGWDLKQSNYAPGSFVIYSDAMNNAQWNQSGNDEFPVLNWHPANNYPILTDEGSSYTFEEYFGEMIDPLSTGWYRINLETLDGLPANYDGTRMINAEAERRQNGTNFYPLQYGPEQTQYPAKEYIHLTVNGSAHRFTALNGHGIQENCTASRTSIADNGPAVSITTDGTYTLGKWHTWVVNGVAYVGKSSSSNNKFTLTRVSDEELADYDIWTIDLTAANHTEVGKDVSVTLDHPANKGISTVFNGGKYFLPVGSEIDPSQLSFTVQKAQDLEDPFVRVDPESKTIQIDYTQIPTIPVSSVELDQETITVEVGQSEKLTATVNPSDATDQDVKWSSSDTAIATVDDEGNVTGVAVGEAVITATCGGEKEECTVTVTDVTIGIKEINGASASKIYDLQGRRVLNPTNGLYIENNKLIRK